MRSDSGCWVLWWKENVCEFKVTDLREAGRRESRRAFRDQKEREGKREEASLSLSETERSALDPWKQESRESTGQFST